MKPKLRFHVFHRELQKNVRVAAGLSVERCLFPALVLLTLLVFMAAFPAKSVADETGSATHELLADDSLPPDDPPPPPDSYVPSDPSETPFDEPEDPTPPPGSDSGVNGWWYNTGLDGTGVSIEVRNGILFLAWYTYDGAGNPIWHISGGLMSSTFQYDGTLTWISGWPLGAPYVPPQPAVSVGTVSITFQSNDSATLTWNLTGESQGSMEIVKFLPDLLARQGAPAGLQDARDINGWWWFGPELNGMGVFVEARGGIIFIAWYQYREDSSPRWWSMGGSFSTVDTAFTGDLTENDGGWSIGMDDSQGAPVGGSMGAATFTLLADGTARLDWNGGVYTLQRFHFDEAQ